MRSILPKVNGAARAIAQGQAIINTAVNTFMALLGSWYSQKVVATKAMVNTAKVKRLPIRSVIL